MSGMAVGAPWPGGRPHEAAADKWRPRSPAALQLADQLLSSRQALQAPRPRASRRRCAPRRCCTRPLGLLPPPVHQRA